MRTTITAVTTITTVITAATTGTTMRDTTMGAMGTKASITLVMKHTVDTQDMVTVTMETT